MLLVHTHSHISETMVHYWSTTTLEVIAAYAFNGCSLKFESNSHLILQSSIKLLQRFVWTLGRCVTIWVRKRPNPLHSHNLLAVNLITSVVDKGTLMVGW